MNRTESKLPTVDELNKAQAEWMKLDPHAPKPEINRVCKLYQDTVPASYLSVTPDQKMAQPVVDGTHMWAAKQTMAQALEWARQTNRNPFVRHKIRLDVAWCGATGSWVTLNVA